MSPYGLTAPYVERVQRECLERFAATRLPAAVLGRLKDAIERLHAVEVPAEESVERNRISKLLEGYTQRTRNVAALQRARDQGLATHPGQDIEYIIVDDDRTSRERVALAHEGVEKYDPFYYETQLVRAVESILSPLGWDRTRTRLESGETRQSELLEYVRVTRSNGQINHHRIL